MNQPITILSLFDGISCGQIAINKLLPKNRKYKYYASEIHDGSMKITQHHYPNTVQLGDVRDLTRDMIPDDIFLLIGGSPCQSFSFAGRRKGMVTTENIEITNLEQYLKLKNEGFEFVGQSYLYWEYIRIKKEFKPKYFLLENVRMNPKWEEIITNGIGVKSKKLNSSLVSAQNRERLYWTNIPNIKEPQDKKIFLDDIIDGAKGYAKRGVWSEDIRKYVQTPQIRKDRKANCLVATDATTQKLIFPDGGNRQLTLHEREILQTLPIGYTDVPGVTKKDKVHATGNCWTVDMIVHLFSHIPELS